MKKPKQVMVSKARLKASICEDSFYEFVQEFWDTIIPEDPVWNWHIEYLCNELQSMAERVFKKLPKLYDLIINISPGSTKSTICSVMFPAWFWTRMKTGRIICGSYAHTLALELSRKTRIIVQSEKYKELWPEFEISEDQNTKGYYTTTAGGGRMAVGTGGSITGFHAHFILVDDPLDPKASLSEADLRTVNNWMRETLPTRKVDKKICPTVLIMQRLCQDDPTGEWLSRVKEGEVKHICLPAELPAPEVQEKGKPGSVSPPELVNCYTDGLMDTVRLDKEVLESYERILGAYGYASQFGQSPVPRGGGAFKTDRIQIEEPPRKFVSRVRYWDKASTRGGGAYTVGLLMGKCRKGFFWVLDVKRGQWDASERESIIKQTAKADGSSVRVFVEQEPGSGGKESAQNTIKNLAGVRVYADRPTGNKELRADPYAVQVNSYNVKMIPAPWNNDYLSELMYWPLSKYKDQVDASSGAFSKLHNFKRRAGAL